MEFVGRTVRKEFEGFGVYSGIVNSYDSSTGFFEVLYEDGDSEELELPEVASLVEGMVGDQASAAEFTKKPSRVGRKPKKRRRVEIGAETGNHDFNLVSGSCLKESCAEIEREESLVHEGFGKTLEKEPGISENRSKDTVLLNGNVKTSDRCDGVDLNHRLNLNYDLNLNDGLNLNEELDLNDGVDSNVHEHLKRGDFIDLNLDINEDDNWSAKQDDMAVPVMDTPKRAHCFDLNLGLDDETKNLDADCDGQLHENTCPRMSEETQKREIGGNLEETQMEGGTADGTSKGVDFEIVEGTPAKGSTESVLGDEIQKEDSVLCGTLKRDAAFAILDSNFVNDNNSSEIQLQGLSDAGTLAVHGQQGNSEGSHEGRNIRKRRKLSESVNSRTETVLRRSTRRGRATFPAQDHLSSAVVSNVGNDPLTSPAVSAVSEEKPTFSGREESEERSVLPPKLQLPPSSENINLDGIPILDLFSVYSFLRSFSTLLFLSPFELEYFVAALKCKAPNLLFDFIHVSLLQTLRKHLEFLSDESSPSASNCLRGLNWDLLDLITWPIFMVEYLLMHSSGLKPDVDLCHMNLFENEYYKQPASIKIEILRCLCDDVIEVEAIRSELNRRTLSTEPNMDVDRTMKFETSKNRRALMDVSCGSCLTEEEVDETTDWNSDECCLCKMDGNLICCDGCPAAFHSRCVGVASFLLPEGEWYCPECVINRDKPWMKVGKSLRGAELLGIDPHGRLYYSSCGYLLVSDSCEAESSFSYYHRNDLTVVVEALKSSETLYGTILCAVSKLCDLSAQFNGMVDSQNVTVCSGFLLKGQMPAISAAPPILAPSETCVQDETMNDGKPEEKSMISTYSGNMGCEVSELLNNNSVTGNHSIKMENPLACSEGSAEISQANTDGQNFQEIGPDCLDISAGILNNYEIPGKPVPVGDYSLMSTNLEVEQGNNIQSADHGCTVPKLSTRGDMSQEQCATGYVNYYCFARTASLIAEELTRKSSDKISEDTTRSVEEIITTQLKAISNKCAEFFWPNLQNLNVDARKEKCGWCFSCKFPDDDRDCLFIMNDTVLIREGLKSDVFGLCSRKNRKGHLVDVMCHILCIEDRLHGLLLGPWLNPHYSKFWRKNVLRASDIASVKHQLLMLESNLRRRALSEDWLKHVDSIATMGSASYVMTSSLRVSSKHGIGRKRTRYSDLVPNRSSNAATGLGLFWWRGGRLSRKLFNWKVLPCSLASKAARQAGCKKIPGVLYPDGVEFAKRSKYVAWQAAVETSRSVEQLALQVRDLDANIRWDDIENTNLVLKMDKEARKSFRSFKKVIIRRKCSEGLVVKYLLDFGKRRFIPDIVVRHGSKLEESSSGRKKYWLEESHVPLHLLKIFEEKRIARKSGRMTSGKLHERGRVMKKSSKNGFLYLFSKAERSENYQCGHCNKDVLVREAVSCQYCKGFFHKRHVRKSAGAVTAECTYTCHKCQDGKPMKTNTKKVKSQSQKSRKATKVLRPVHSKSSRKSSKEKHPARAQNSRKDSVVVPLRRSPRKLTCVSLQSKKIVRRKKGKQTKSRKGTSKKPKKSTWRKKRTQMHRTYWLNGLLLTRKPNDERVMVFRNKKLFVPSEKLMAILDQQKCSLCCEPEFSSALNYIGCEICGDWFHGDAFGLRAEIIGNLIGFKCHKCRNRNPPVCPHLHAIRGGKAQFCASENGVGIECADEVSNAFASPSEAIVEQKSHPDEESRDLFSNDSSHKEQQSGTVSDLFLSESSHKEQESGTVPDSNQAPVLDAVNGDLTINMEQKTEAPHNTSEKDLQLANSLVEANENTSLEDNTIKLSEGHAVSVTTLVETGSLESKSTVDVIDTGFASLGHNRVKNGLVKEPAILGSVVNKTIFDSSELPQQATLASGESPDGEEKM